MAILLQENFAKKLSIKHHDYKFMASNTRLMLEAFDKSYPESKVLFEAHGLNPAQQVIVKIIAEAEGKHPNQLLMEKGLMSKIGNFIKNMFGGAKNPESMEDLSDLERNMYKRDMARSEKGMFGRGKSAFKANDDQNFWRRGTSTAAAAISPYNLFRHGAHFNKKDAIAKARKSFAEMVAEFEKDEEQNAARLTKVIKTAAKKTDFPNNEKYSEFHQVLFGQPNIEELEKNQENMGGIAGAIFQYRDVLQQKVDSGLLPIDVGNKIVDKLRDVIKFYMGETQDAYQSLNAHHDKKRRHQRMLREKYSIANRLMLEYSPDPNYKGPKGENPMLAGLENIEGMIDQGGTKTGSGKVSGGMENKLDKAMKQLSKEEGLNRPGQNKKLGAFGEELGKVIGKNANDPKALKDLFAGKKDVPGYDPAAFSKILSSQESLKPLLAALGGAIMLAGGISIGGNPFGYFENSLAYTKYVNSLKGYSIGKIIRTMPAAISNSYAIPDGTGLTDMAAHFGVGGGSATAVQNMSMTDFMSQMQSKLGIANQTQLENCFRTFMPGINDPSAIAAMNGAGSTTVKDFFAQHSEYFSGKTLSAAGHPSPFGIPRGAIAKWVSKTVIKKSVHYAYPTMKAATMGGIVGAALPTILATAGTGMLASGLAIAALRKFGKNRVKTLKYILDKIEDLVAKGQTPPNVPKPVTKVLPTQIVKPFKEEDPQPLHKDPKVKASYDLVIRFLHKKGYDKKEAFKLLTTLYNPEHEFGKQSIEDFYDGEETQEQLAAHKKIKYSLKSVLLKEDISYKLFSDRMKQAAEKAGVPELNKEQLRAAAIAFNNAYIIGDVDETTFPKDVLETVIEVESEELKKKYQDAIAQRDEAESVLKVAMQDASNKLGLKAKSIDELTAKLNDALEKDKLSERQKQAAAKEIDRLMAQVEAIQAGASEDAATLNAEIQRLSAELIVVTQDSKYAAAMSKQEKQKLLKNIERLSQQLDVSQAELASGKVKISDLEAALAKKDVDLEDALALADDLQEQLNQALADANAAKESSKKYDGNLADLAKLYYGLIGKETDYINPEGETESLSGIKSVGSIARSLQYATDHKPHDVYAKIKKRGNKADADQRYRYLKQFNSEMRDALDSVDAAMDKNVAVTNPLKQFKKQIAKNERERQAAAKDTKESRVRNEGNLLLERWHKLAGLK